MSSMSVDSPSDANEQPWTFSTSNNSNPIQLDTATADDNNTETNEDTSKQPTSNSGTADVSDDTEPNESIQITFGVSNEVQQTTFGLPNNPSNPPTLFGTTDPNHNNDTSNQNSTLTQPTESMQLDDTKAETDEDPSKRPTSNGTKPSESTQFTFGVPSVPNNSNGTPLISFGTTDPTNNNHTSNQNPNGIQPNKPMQVSFGTDATATTDDNKAQTNEDPSKQQPTSNGTKPSQSSPFTFGVSNQPILFGTTASTSQAVASTSQVPASSATPFGSWQPVANDSNPFAAFNSNNQSSDATNTTTTPTAPPVPLQTTFTAPPVIPDGAIDVEARDAFQKLFRQQTEHQWRCDSCANYNPDTTNICESCEARRSNPPPPPLMQTPCKVSSTQFGIHKDGHAYYDVLKDNDELLHYDTASHPVLCYFPYMHEHKGEELNQEGPEAWLQFDDVDGSSHHKDVKVRTYREYIRRRNMCKQQMRHTKIEKGEVLIAMTGDGSMGGQLGVGNGSVTRIPNNIAPFPFILDTKIKDIQSTATGIMSTAVVSDNQIYVWGLNDKSELTINPHNIEQVDVGDDDDQLSPEVAWPKLYDHYSALITSIYEVTNPDKLTQEGFVKMLLIDQKVGKLVIRFGDKSKVIEGVLKADKVENNIAKFKEECQCELSKKKKKSDAVVVDTEEQINIEETADGMHQLYLRICKKYNIEDEVPLFVPKASEEEMRQRKDRKLNPYKYMDEEEVATE
eukprot:509573_1